MHESRQLALGSWFKCQSPIKGTAALWRRTADLRTEAGNTQDGPRAPCDAERIQKITRGLAMVGPRQGGMAATRTPLAPAETI